MAKRKLSPLQQSFHTVIFGTTTPMGKWFDIALIWIILVSVLIIMLDSIAELHILHGQTYLRLEFIFTAFFTVEYFTRIWCAPNRKAYMLSGFGIVDLLALLPTYIAFLLPGASSLLIIRLLRIFRIFRILRLFEFIAEANILATAMRASGRKIFLFFSMMIIITTIFGCLMYVIEGAENGFDNIPISIYWAIVTVTTVGYGDLVPLTAAGRAVSALAMLMGYAIIAVPTGIITAELAAEMSSQKTLQRNSRNCKTCGASGHEPDAHYCAFCGEHLEQKTAIIDAP
ncbi:MAG: ion transporter [Halioglobus sp.]